jgi:predicted metalloprotease
MKWKPEGMSDNVEDRRGQTAGGGFGGGRFRLGLGGVVVLLLLSLIFRKNFFQLVETVDPGTAPSLGASPPAAATPEEDTLALFVSFVLDTAQATWARTLPRLGVPYENAHLVLFRDGVESACGFAQTATGPFYCPGDHKVYIDLGFYQELRDRFGAAGDFAQAYVLAHEIGHHIQTLLGTEADVRRAQRRGGREGDLSVRMELQADCYAGVWGHAANAAGMLEAGDLEEGINAAAAVGDDRLQRMATGHVNPERFTHGSSAQRAAWFRRGFDTGRLDACDTFSGPIDLR